LPSRVELDSFILDREARAYDETTLLRVARLHELPLTSPKNWCGQAMTSRLAPAATPSRRRRWCVLGRSPCRRECRAKTWEQRSLPCLVQIYDRWLTQLEPHIFGHTNMVSASPPTHEFLLSFAPALIFDDHLDARQTPVFSAKKSFRLLS
jgi:hypothetical protein